MAISLNTLATSLSEEHTGSENITSHHSSIKILHSLLIVETAFTRCNIHDAEGNKWSVKQQQLGNCSRSRHKEEDGNQTECSE
jgi:hypothetical protein